MVKRHLVGSIIRLLALVSLIGLATTPLLADSIPVYHILEATLVATPFGFTYDLDGVANGVSGVLIIHGGTGTSTLPSCPNPCVAGAMFNPSTLLTFSGFSGAVDATGKSRAIPSGSDPKLVEHVMLAGIVTSPRYSMKFDRGATVILYFSGNGNLTLRSETYVMVPESGTLALFGTGLAFLGCLGRLKILPWTS